ncbi:hypothetical protein Tco_0654839 [Tanacetum coccineum]|uniref:Uncharacterized protein n=1 Tax=Tanacetum coccineum TaxID=301880 RepID=A0ABQ4X5A5_9ASTR
MRKQLLLDLVLGGNRRGKLFKTVGLKWIPTRKIFTSSTTKVDSEPPNGSKEDITNQCESEQALDVSADISKNKASRNFDLMINMMMSDHNSSDLAPQRQMVSAENNTSGPVPQCLMTSVHISSGLVLHQMTSDHNRSELGIQVHGPMHSHVQGWFQKKEKVLLSNLIPTNLNFTMILKSYGGRLGINPLITERRTLPKMRHSMRMLVKDTRSQDGIDEKDNDKGSKSRSQSMKEQAYNKEQRERQRPHEFNDKSNLIDLIKECIQ